MRALFILLSALGLLFLPSVSAFADEKMLCRVKSVGQRVFWLDSGIFSSNVLYKNKSGEFVDWCPETDAQSLAFGRDTAICKFAGKRLGNKLAWGETVIDFEKFSDGVNINKNNVHLFEESFLIHIKRITSQRLKMLDGLIGLCPMLGLLGTVYGMIEVFEVLAVLGTGNPRAMSTGVAKATIPTMAGMTIALSGLFFKFDLANKVERYQEDARLYLKKMVSV